jgi:hypothetical protein
MRITIATVDGTPEELASLPEELRSMLSGFRQESGTGGVQPSQESADLGTPEVGAELRDFIRDRARSEATRVLVERYAAELLSWDGTHSELGRSSQTADGLGDMFMIKRTGTAYGGFVYVYPGTTRVTFRLADEESTGRRHGYKRNVKPEDHYQVSLKLRSDEALAEAVELARAAVEAIEADLS